MLVSRMTEGYVTTEDGLRLFFQALGNGPALLVVPNGFHLFEDFERLAQRRTLVVYDVRNRGRSDAVTDEAKLARGIHNDVDDLELVRRHFGADAVDLLGHSYVATTVALYAMKHPARVKRVIQMGPMPPNAAKQYPAHLTGDDGVMAQVLPRLAQLQAERASLDPAEFCQRVWSVLRVIYVTDPADAHKIRWDRCELPNERSFMKYWTERIFPSIQALDLQVADLAAARMPALVVHGRRDRSAPYGGGADWARLWPDARLVTVDHAGHAPWIEAPDAVFGALETFLDGSWPAAAEAVLP